MTPPPENPKIYHIVHVDRLASIVSDGCLWSDAVMANRGDAGTSIAIGEIKARRLRLSLSCRPGLRVGECVPFYFCPRSIMLYIIHCANHPNLEYRGGQEPIVHLEADLRSLVEWAERNERRWAFTLSNAGAVYFEDRCDLAQLGDIDWLAVQATSWVQHKEGKQAEFLVEESFPWELVERIGCLGNAVAHKAAACLEGAAHRPPIEIRGDWYY